MLSKYVKAVVMTGCCDFKIRGFGVSLWQSRLFWSKSHRDHLGMRMLVRVWWCVIMSDVSVSLRRPGELWHGVREGWHQESHSMLENKQTRVMRPRAWGSWHGDVSPPSWHEWHLLTFLPGSSWALSTPDMINLFIFPELRGALVRDGYTGLWLVSSDLLWSLIGQY